MNNDPIEKNLKSEMTKNMSIKDHVKIILSDIDHILDVRDQLIGELTNIMTAKTFDEFVELISYIEEILMLISEQDQLLINYLDDNCNKYKVYDIYYEIIKHLNSKSISSIEKKANDDIKEVEKKILMVFKDFFKTMEKWKISYHKSIYKPMRLDYVMNRMLRYKKLANKGYYIIFENDYFACYRKYRHNIFLPTIKLTYGSYDLFIYIDRFSKMIISDCGDSPHDDSKSEYIYDDSKNIFNIVREKLGVQHEKSIKEKMIKEQEQKLFEQKQKQFEQNKKTTWGRIKNFIFYYGVE